MKCSRTRIALLTFIIGLLSVPFANYLQVKWIDASVELPKVKSISPLYIFERHHPKEVNAGGGSN